MWSVLTVAAEWSLLLGLELLQNSGNDMLNSSSQDVVNVVKKHNNNKNVTVRGKKRHEKLCLTARRDLALSFLSAVCFLCGKRCGHLASGYNAFQGRHLIKVICAGMLKRAALAWAEGDFVFAKFNTRTITDLIIIVLITEKGVYNNVMLSNTDINNWILTARLYIDTEEVSFLLLVWVFFFFTLPETLLH